MHLRSLALLAAILLPLPMMADTTYSYAGQNFTAAYGSYTTSDSISGWFTVASPLADDFGSSTNPYSITNEVTSFSFSDGLQTISSTNASDDRIEVTTDASGSIVNWVLVFEVGNSQKTLEYIETVNVEGDKGNIDYAYDTNINNGTFAFTYSAGTWSETSTTATPEPSSIVLLLTGLAGITGAARRKLAR